VQHVINSVAYTTLCDEIFAAVACFLQLIITSAQYICGRKIITIEKVYINLTLRHVHEIFLSNKGNDK
jgi:hypothetical protein